MLKILHPTRAMATPSLQTHDEQPPGFLIRQIVVEGSEGALEILQGAKRALVFFRNHHVIHAESMGRKGAAALYEILGWEQTTSKWYPGLRPSVPTFDLTLEDFENPEPAETSAFVPEPRDVSEVSSQPPRTAPAVLPELYHQDLESGLLDQHIISLDWADAPGGPQTFRFEGNVQSGCLIGSGQDCQFILPHPSIEPLHCSLMIHSDYVEIWDLGSGDKTRVNGVVTEQAILTSGDRLTVGEVELLFTLRIRRRFTAPSPNTPLEETIPAPAKPSGGTIPRTAITYASIAAAAPPKPGVVKAIRRMFFRTTGRVQYSKK
ncbi:MAG: FHA domain-containing protein [Candidatus Methylacidiphilales bacterium]|nr:FHA domain-containing protein [Candidatus Methylacidiphilales bacterium]